MRKHTLSSFSASVRSNRRRLFWNTETLEEEGFGENFELSPLIGNDVRLNEKKNTMYSGCKIPKSITKKNTMYSGCKIPKSITPILHIRFMPFSLSEPNYIVGNSKTKFTEPSNRLASWILGLFEIADLGI
ncbi:unnamed protein product [Cuscuta epithymum]|uniref:Uncharacterized protein n=1 Tax=Cuscuta epithymum TaxID=186058 RepID=A0AAV0CL67_9ASTE|nr:unnamed protein product [Cuscuta epithymum]